MKKLNVKLPQGGSKRALHLSLIHISAAMQARLLAGHDIQTG